MMNLSVELRGSSSKGSTRHTVTNSSFLLFLLYLQIDSAKCNEDENGGGGASVRLALWFRENFVLGYRVPLFFLVFGLLVCAPLERPPPIS